MCYFLGICSTYKTENEKFNLDQSLEVKDVTKFEDNPRANMRYYEILHEECACQLFRRRNFIMFNLDQQNIPEQINNDYSTKIKKFIEKLPGNSETEVLVVLADEKKNYSIRKDYEIMRKTFPIKELPKQKFIDRYPFIEDDLVYLLI